MNRGAFNSTSPAPRDARPKLQLTSVRHRDTKADYCTGYQYQYQDLDNHVDHVLRKESKERMLDELERHVDTFSDELELVEPTTVWGRFLTSLRNGGVLHPQSYWHLGWLLIVSTCFVYNCVVIPLRYSFPYQTPDNWQGWFYCDLAADAVYVLDLLVVKPHVIFLYDGFWVREKKLTRHHYFEKCQFKLDIFSLTPLDLFYLKYGTENWTVLFRLPRVLKIQTFWELYDHLDSLLMSPYLVRVVRTLFYMMFLVHMNACAYYAFSAKEGLGANSWTFAGGEGNAYIRCFYFATKTATSVGKNPRPETVGEYLFMTCSWLMGVFVFALLIGQIRDIVATATRTKTEYRQRLDETLEHMRRLSLPDNVQQRVQSWFTFTAQHQPFDEAKILNSLPQKLKTDVAIDVHGKTLDKVQLFNRICDQALIRELVLKLRSVLYLPGDYICRKNEVGKEMYIVKTGQVEVVVPNTGEILATLSEGSVFGEISLLSLAGGNRRTADVRSKGFSNLFVLSKHDLNETLVYYPDAQEILKQKAEQLMLENAEREKKEMEVMRTSPTSSQESSSESSSDNAFASLRRTVDAALLTGRPTQRRWSDSGAASPRSLSRSRREGEGEGEGEARDRHRRGVGVGGRAGRPHNASFSVPSSHHGTGAETDTSGWKRKPEQGNDREVPPAHPGGKPPASEEALMFDITTTSVPLHLFTPPAPPPGLGGGLRDDALPCVHVTDHDLDTTEASSATLTTVTRRSSCTSSVSVSSASGKVSSAKYQQCESESENSRSMSVSISCSDKSRSRSRSRAPELELELEHVPYSSNSSRSSDTTRARVSSPAGNLSDNDDDGDTLSDLSSASMRSPQLGEWRRQSVRSERSVPLAPPALPLALDPTALRRRVSAPTPGTPRDRVPDDSVSTATATATDATSDLVDSSCLSGAQTPSAQCSPHGSPCAYSPCPRPGTPTPDLPDDPASPAQSRSRSRSPFSDCANLERLSSSRQNSDCGSSSGAGSEGAAAEGAGAEPEEARAAGAQAKFLGQVTVHRERDRSK